MNLRLKTVNKELAKLGEVKLVKGEGYFYFYGDLVDESKESGVYGGITNLNQLSLESWIDEANSRIIAEK